MIPATALVSGTALPQHRGSFMSIVSCVQQLSAAAASYIGGIIVTRGPEGRLLNFNYIGYTAVIFSFVAIYLSRRVQAIEGSGDIRTSQTNLHEPVV